MPKTAAARKAARRDAFHAPHGRRTAALPGSRAATRELPFAFVTGVTAEDGAA